MPRRETAPLGAPCWIDLMTSDPDKTAAFYTALFGWTVDDPGPDYGGYKNFHKDGIPVAGFMKNPGDVPDAWSIYLATDDAKATVADAAAQGSHTIVEPQDVMTLGTMAMVTDPGGAAIGVWRPGDHKGFGIYDEPDTPGWFELHTREYDKSVQFYKDVFHWPVHTAMDEPEFRYTTYGEGDNQLAGIMDGTAYLPDGVPAQWSMYVRVQNTDATIARATELGATTLEPAQDTPYGRLAALADTTGSRFKLVGLS